MANSFNKGLGPEQHSDWNLLREDLCLPTAVLRNSAVEQNIQWMQAFAKLYGVQLAPHGKTTMAPELFKRQIDAGAWGMTLATAPQVVAAHRHGISRILMANQLVGRQAMELIAECQKDSEFEFYCVVDSVTNANQLNQFFSGRQQTLRVLIELGVPGGRCGVRNDDDFDNLVNTIHNCTNLTLCGIEFYEGVIHGINAETQIRNFIQSAVTKLNGLASKGTPNSWLITGAGSAWYDLVAEEFAQADLPENCIPLLRPGCYAIHDTGIYQEAQNSVVARNRVACELGPELTSSLEIWAYIQSIPEPGKAVVGMGKRDVAFDAGLPTAEKIVRCQPNSEDNTIERLTEVNTTHIMDQHAYIQYDPKLNLQVGDMLGFSTSHPCLTFDKWRKVCVLDDNHNVISVIDTCF
ncbi:amino acid deaminase [Teredinibacter sp. KSP-S5-2]|uniref:amino acid deaminase n=1 Tax=Teredinibacter sp. KSP-S5-2 TaxID=3034506 RepID=UPI002935060B|nr:amino acid deaminase [Teredinibacter sp. KSP-S5-2]WNO08506.1 amino acid deaminase [Teredinibacter sp. KSP-S5-2]